MMQQAAILLEQILRMDKEDPHALPGSVLKHVKAARQGLVQDIQKRRAGRKREAFKRTKGED